MKYRYKHATTTVIITSVKAKERRYIMTGVIRYLSVGRGKSGSTIISMVFTEFFFLLGLLTMHAYQVARESYN